MSNIRHCEGCDRLMNVAEQELARKRRDDGMFCGACRDGATIYDLRQQLRGAVGACAEAYSALTRERDLGPDTSEAAVEAARGYLAAILARPVGQYLAAILARPVGQ